MENLLLGLTLGNFLKFPNFVSLVQNDRMSRNYVFWILKPIKVIETNKGLKMSQKDGVVDFMTFVNNILSCWIKNRFYQQIFSPCRTRYINLCKFPTLLKKRILTPIINAFYCQRKYCLLLHGHFLYRTILYKKMSLKNHRALIKMLRKSPPSNNWAAISKNTDFF